MSFLDNLENNLKSLESSEDGKDAVQQARARERQRAAAEAVAPWADQLKRSPFTTELLRQASRISFSKRTKVHIAWLGSTLRLEAREKRLELRPTPGGIVAAYLEGQQEIRVEPVDLSADPADLVSAWLA